MFIMTGRDDTQARCKDTEVADMQTAPNSCKSVSEGRVSRILR